MSKVYAFLATGSEEVECLAVLDVLIRGGIEVKLVSVTGELDVMTAHKISVKADCLFEEIDCMDADVLFIPGGIPGTPNLAAHKGLCDALVKAAGAGKRISAICAAPSVLGGLGLLKGKRAACYPGYEDQLVGAEAVKDGVVTDGMVTTGRGLGYALDLGIELLALLTDRENAGKVKTAIQYDRE